MLSRCRDKHGSHRRRAGMGLLGHEVGIHTDLLRCPPLMTAGYTTGPAGRQTGLVFLNNVKLVKRRGVLPPELFLFFPILFLVFPEFFQNRWSSLYSKSIHYCAMCHTKAETSFSTRPLSTSRRLTVTECQRNTLTKNYTYGPAIEDCAMCHTKADTSLSTRPLSTSRRLSETV